MDMLTNLPKEIKEQILTYLPINEAGRTSLLSSNWRNTWTSIPELKFVENEIISDHSNSEYMLAKVIDAVFARHNGPILKFSLFTEIYIVNLEMDRWIENLSKNGIREITFHLPIGYIEIFPEMPSRFFFCDKLSYINLRGCVLGLPLWFEGFKFLRTLVVKDIIVSALDFEKLVSSCTLLKKLILIGLEGVIKIHSTNLEHLEIKESRWGDGLDLQVYAQRLENAELDGSFTKIQLNAPKLRNLCTNVKPHEADDGIGKIKVQYIGDVPDLKKVHIKYLQRYPIGPWTEELLLFNRLKYLSLDLYHHLALGRPHVEFLEKVINLQVLDINVHYCSFNSQWPAFWGKQVGAKENLFKHLKTVNIVNFRALHTILLFVKFILDSAPQLVTLTIKQDPCYKADERIMYTQLCFRRASSKVEIIYK